MSPNRGQVLDLVNPFHLLPPLHLATLNQITVSSTCEPILRTVSSTLWDCKLWAGHSEAAAGTQAFLPRCFTIPPLSQWQSTQERNNIQSTFSLLWLLVGPHCGEWYGVMVREGGCSSSRFFIRGVNVATKIAPKWLIFRRISTLEKLAPPGRGTSCTTLKCILQSHIFISI